MYEVDVHFVLPKGRKEDDCDSEMLQAYSHCSLHTGSGINAQWITEEECNITTDFDKKDVYVLQEFKGSLFHKLVKTKALVVGARCLSCCLTEGTPIPPGPHPVYTIAMRGLVVTASGFTKEAKENIRTKVFWMGGKYDNALNSTTTHLIANTIFSDKYTSAVSSNIPVMHADWIEAIWCASLERNVSGSDETFVKQHKLPTFFGAIVTTTGFNKREKEKIAKLVDNNGGSFKGNFESVTTDIVVISNSGIGSEKHKAGVEHGKQCVTASWVYDSAKAGYALPSAMYGVYENKTSSPIGSGKLPDMSINVSTIMNVRNPVLSSVDDTCSTTMSSDSSKIIIKKQQDTLCSTQKTARGGRLCPVVKELGQLVDGLDMKEVRQAGTILEDCAVYVYGVTVSRRDKLHRVIDRCGGMRFSTCHDQVTHALCGDPSKGPMEKESMPKAMHVTIRWLVDSVRAKKLLDETQYLVVDAAPNSRCESASKNKTHQQRQPQLHDSPMSKRNLQLLQTHDEGGGVNRPPVPLFKLDALNGEEADKDDIVQQYREHSQIAVGDSEDALAQYFKQGGNTFTSNLKEADPPMEKTDNNVTLRREQSIRPDDNSISHIRVKGGEEKTVVEGVGPSDATTMTESSADTANLFNGLTFEFQGIEESSALELAVTITESGGRVVDPMDSEDTCDPDTTYVIVPMEYDEEDVINKNARVINTFWLDDCLTQMKIVDVEYYHRPVKLAICSRPLCGLTIGISNYLAVERSFVDELAQLLGATTQNTFCRRNAGSNKASTHLICPTAEGNKYVGAVKWGLPAVKSEWLLECARRGKRVREGPYLVGDTKEPEGIYDESSESKLENQTVVNENKENISCQEPLCREKTITDVDICPEEEPAKDNVTLQKELDQSVEDVCMVPEQAGTHKRKSMASDSFSNIKFNSPRAKAKLSLGPSTEMSPVSRILARARMPDSQETPKRVSELCKEAKLANESVRTPPMDNALSTPNLAVFSPTSRRRLQAIKRGEMPSDTIRTPKNPFETTSVPTPESPFGAALRPETGHMSADSKKKLQKFIDQLPDLQRDDRNKETPISEMSKKFFSKFDKCGQQFSAAKQLNISDADNTPPAKHRKLHHVETPEQSIENQLRQLNSIVSAANTTSFTPRSNKKSLVPADVDMGLSGCEEDERRGVTGTGGDSQAYTVGWDDVTPSVAQSKDITRASVEQKVYKFIISMNVQNRDEILSTIESLGGTVSESGEYDSSITHLIHGKPSRSEKVLAAIAAGIWLVHPSYVDRSKEEGKFINEEEYEWGNPLATSLPKLESAADCSVANAAYRWRLSRTQGRFLPFHNMKLLLHVPPSRKPPLIRVITSGGGVVLDAVVPFHGEHEATLCIAENSILPFNPEDLEYLVEHRIPVCPPTYISKVLMETSLPEALNYAYPFYTRRLKERFG